MSEFLKKEGLKRIAEKKDSLFKITAGKRTVDPMTFRPTIQFTLEYCMESAQDIRSIGKFQESQYGGNSVEHLFGEAIIKALNDAYMVHIGNKTRTEV